MHHTNNKAFDDAQFEGLPAAVRNLAPREREVATAIYKHNALTAMELSRELGWPGTHGALRVMLQRLVAKGILTRRHSGYGKTFLYVPALSTKDTAELAFTRLAEDFYGGSFLAAADAIKGLLARGTLPSGGHFEAR
jgi:predicted transcriptional regulator